MAGQFINTKHGQTISSLVSGMQDILKNPYYVWSNKSPTIVTYYNTNKEKSTLDEGSKLQGMPFGKDSPTYFNVIKNFYLYGIEPIQISIENGDFGAEGGDIAGEAIILPNTIIPYPGDYFTIDYLKEDVMFRVTGVTHDTMEDGANIYKLNYEMDFIEKKDLDTNLADRYNMVINNVGTGFNPILREEKYNFIERIEGVLSYLKKHYKAVFYNDRIQSFSFLHEDFLFYDSYMIQFLMNNSILKDDEYLYICHQLPVGASFVLNYDKCILHCFEEMDFKNLRKYRYKTIGRFIEDRVSIFTNRPEEYFQIDYNFLPVEENLYKRIPCIKEELLDGIEQNKLFDDENAMYNIIIKFVNNISINDKDIDDLKFMDYEDNCYLFYAIPLIIFSLEYIVKDLMIKR